MDVRVKESRSGVGGFTGWLLARFARGRHRAAPRLALLERIALAPRQSVALIEAEGRRILVATSADGASAFYPLDRLMPGAAAGGERFRTTRTSKSAAAGGPGVASRISW